MKLSHNMTVTLIFIAAAGVILSLSLILHRLNLPTAPAAIIRPDILLVLAAIVIGIAYQLRTNLTAVVWLAVIAFIALALGIMWHLAMATTPTPLHFIFLLCSGMVLGIWTGRNRWDIL